MEQESYKYKALPNYADGFTKRWVIAKQRNSALSFRRHLMTYLVLGLVGHSCLLKIHCKGYSSHKDVRSNTEVRVNGFWRD